jgi:hypothetical protein
MLVLKEIEAQTGTLSPGVCRDVCVWRQVGETDVGETVKFNIL